MLAGLPTMARLALLLAGLPGSGLLSMALLGLVLLALLRLGLLGVLVVCHRVGVSTATVRRPVRLPLLSAFPSLTPAVLRRPPGLRRIRSRNFARQ